MFTMNRVLTIEERTLLQSIECKDKLQAIEVLEGFKMILPIRSEMFRNVLMLIEKLKNESIDYTYENSCLNLK